MPHQMGLLGHMTPDQHGWVPDELPSLDGIDMVFGDTETTGLRWYGNDLITGMSICTPDGRKFYFPVRHSGGNLPLDSFHRWAKRELRNKKIVFFNAPFDMNFMRKEGIDLEAQGCTFSDAAHWTALLDDLREDSKLDTIAKDYLGYGKLPMPFIEQMAEMHASEVAEYAKHDPWLLHELWKLQEPMLRAEGLMRVLELENECVPATAEMMWNGAPLDEELLDQWLRESEAEYAQSLWDLTNAAGWQVKPGSFDDHCRLFDQLGIAYPRNDQPKGPREGKVTFERRYLDKVDHPTVRLLRRSLRLKSVRSKYLVPYKEELRKYGRLLYSLNQLRTGEEDEEDVGTKSGRYSSSAYKKSGDGANIQQVAGKKHAHAMKEEVGWKYHVRKLFKAANGQMWCSADADQIEYRTFAHYGQPKTVMEAYAKDPSTNFHKITQKMIEEYIEITYERTKDCNFAGLYMAGVDKFEWMIGLSKGSGHDLYNAYHEAVPEVRRFGNLCMRVAKQRGYVKTIMGRRARFPKELQHRLHAACNRVVQGTAADEMKTKIVALRKAKTGLLMRFVVHDEVNGDVPTKEAARHVSQVLNSQLLTDSKGRAMRVPLTWTVNTGPNWLECKKAA